MQQIVDRVNPLTKPGVSVQLIYWQRVLPIAILAAVLLYELGFELLLVDRVGSNFRFGLELLVFGVLGATGSWVMLEWLRRYTEREAKAAAMAARQDRLLAVLTAGSADAIFMLDSNGVIKTWNRGAEQLFGYRPNEAIGQEFARLLPKVVQTEREPLRFHQEQATPNGTRNSISQRVTQDGRTVTTELTQTCLRDDDGQVIGSAIILRDVTERERSEQQIHELNRQLEIQVAQRTQALSYANEELRHRQRELEKANSELKQLDELKSEFVSLASHELRAPLANISGSLELLLANDDTVALSPHQLEMLSLAKEQVERLARLVKDILDVSRIESGQMQLTPKAFDVLSLITHTLEQWQTCAIEHIWLGPNCQNLPSVWADRDRVDEVLTNLLDNAYKYSQPGSTVQVDVQPMQDQLVICVSDQGSGIPADELAKIFDKFHRVERGDARQTYGYGLGLYISRKLVESMGGMLWVESNIACGSKFSFSLPLAGKS